MGLTGNFNAPCFACGRPYGSHQMETDRCPDPNGGWAAASTFVPRPPPAIPIAPPPRIDPEAVFRKASDYARQGHVAQSAMIMAIVDAANRELQVAHRIIAEQGKKIELLLKEIGTVSRALAEVLPKKPAPTRPSVAKCYCGTTVVFQEFADAQLCSSCGKVHSR